MSAMIPVFHPPMLPLPSRANLAKGHWECVGITTPCTYLYQANMGPMYLGIDPQGIEQWFGRDGLYLASHLWSWNDGFESWIRMDATRGPAVPSPPSRPIPIRTLPVDTSALSMTAESSSVAKVINDGNPVKRSGDVARAMSTDEKRVRTMVDIGHTIGSIALAITGGASGPKAAEGLGKLEQSALDAGYGKR